MMKNNNQKGFTLVELMIAMAFLGILLMVMTVSVIHISGLYNKGLTIKSINQAGRDLGERLRRDTSNALTVPEPFVEPSDASAWLGRMCLGGYTYVWSPAEKLLDGTALKYTSTSTPIVLARVPDGSSLLCQKDASGVYPTAINKAKAEEMLPVDKGDYAIHSISLERIPTLGAPVSNETLYDIRYTIGTNDKDSINTTDQSCKAPSGDGVNSNYQFCAVNSFELIIRAG